MSSFDEFPRRDRNREIEDAAETAFEKRLIESGAFMLQARDRRDYGTDYQIEVMRGGQVTNVRVHVQVKGTDSALNADGTLSVTVQRTNLNYLLMQSCSVYVAYHVPTGSLRIRTTDDVVRHYEHSGKNWIVQKTLTVVFADELTNDGMSRLADFASAAAASSRDRRVSQVGLNAEDLPSGVLNAPPDVHVPHDPVLAAKLLVQLYEQNADLAISGSFSKFAAVLGSDSDAMGVCYMAEINLGMDGMALYPERINEAIRFFKSKLTGDHHITGGLHYTIGNAFHALHNEQEAKRSYDSALADPALASNRELAAQVHKNLGSSLELLGEQDQAVEHYQEALRLSPDLAEAHNALGSYYVRLGEYASALHHYDQVMFSEQQQGRISSVRGWRANVLFNLDDGEAAFREINDLVSHAGRFRWIWPWCRRLVSSFGRTNVENARQAASFWRRYIKANSVDPVGRWELILTNLYLRQNGEDIGRSYSEFREEFERHITYIDGENGAFPWDRLGHWAQDEENWEEAERCFRKAYQLAGGEYGYCLAIALKALERFDESVPLLLDQAKSVQPDAMSWFQLGGSYSSLGRWAEAIDAYAKALAVDPECVVAMFDLGGAYWNSGDKEGAATVWRAAVERFPNHELTAKVKHDFPKLFGNWASAKSSDEGD